nr:TM2 domain-containing protein [uncultured Ligilactobacillus sp.]
MNHTISYNQLNAQEKILVDSQVANKAKKPVVAWLLWLFLGYFGGHRFYFGKTGSAVVMLILSLTFFGAVISIPWMLIDAFFIQRWVHESEEQVEKEAIAELAVSKNLNSNN